VSTPKAGEAPQQEQSADACANVQSFDPADSYRGTNQVFTIKGYNKPYHNPESLDSNDVYVCLLGENDE
jgi:hypothetical protein